MCGFTQCWCYFSLNQGRADCQSRAENIKHRHQQRGRGFCPPWRCLLISLVSDIHRPQQDNDGTSAQLCWRPQSLFRGQICVLVREPGGINRQEGYSSRIMDWPHIFHKDTEYLVPPGSVTCSFHHVPRSCVNLTQSQRKSCCWLSPSRNLTPN